VSKLRSVQTVPAASFDRKNQFSWQLLSPLTDVILLDDISREFKIEPIFSEITDGITIEKKWAYPIFLTFEESPKFVITTNYSIAVQGPSAARRLHEVELTPFFNQYKTIYDHYKHNFFDDWDEAEWMRFYMYMFKCCRCFLTIGLKRDDSDSIREKRLIATTNYEFVNFLDNAIALGTIKLDQYYSLKEIYEDLINNIPDLKSRLFELSYHRLRIWIEKYAEYRGYFSVFERKRVKKGDPDSPFSPNPTSAFAFKSKIDNIIAPEA
jgi:hypothetical protein